MTGADQPAGQGALARNIGLPGAVALNVMNMVGVGPFITLPLVLGAMGGPQAALGWLLGALIAVCDGLVWAELGAAMPRAGGSYVFLREIYRRDPPRFDLGRYFGFLYIWQLSFTAPLSIASGCLGLSQYAAYLWPSLNQPVLHGVHRSNLLAALTCALVVTLLYRGLSAITRVAGVLTLGLFLTFAAILTAGFSHLQPSLLHIASGALHPSHGFFLGLGAATLIATYDYWGYYNVCFLGGEVRRPERTIPTAILLSIALVATLYLLMQFAVVGALPWRELVPQHAGSTPQPFAAVLLGRFWGHAAAVGISLLIMWTAFASVTALLLGYSRAPYAAAVDGNYFAPFARLHPRHGFPHISMLSLGAMAMLFCFLPLARVIAALVAVRIVLQYILQQAGVIVLRWRQPQLARPFRLWLYPLPPLLALAGFLFLLLSRKGAGRELVFAAAVAITGTALFVLRERSLSRAQAGQS